MHIIKSRLNKKNETGNLPYKIPVICFYDKPTHHQKIVGKNMWGILDKVNNNMPIKSANKCK